MSARPLPPGPRPSRVPLVDLIRARRRGLLPFVSDLYQRHGDVVFFRMAGRPFALVSEPELIRQILVTDNARFTKSDALKGTNRVLGEGLLTSEGDHHRAQRRMIQPAFHAHQVKAYADGFVAQTRRLSDAWRDGLTIELGEQMTELTLRVVTQALFGVELEAEAGPIGRDMAALVEMFERTRSPFRMITNRLPLPSNRRFAAALVRLDARIGAMIDARHAAPDAGRFDLLSLLLMAHGDEGATMTERQVRDEAVTLFLAGHETTANALIWTWLLLAEHSSAESALHAELDAVLGDRELTADDVPRLPYARAVLAESMRLRPPAWIIARKSAEAYDVGAHRLPAGTTILMSQYLVHRDPRWWPDAERFAPERWLDDAAAAAGRPKYAYFPFGGGPRSCVGEPFAWLEAIALLVTIARRWRLMRVDDRPIALFPTITLRPPRPRLDASDGKTLIVSDLVLLSRSATDHVRSGLDPDRHGVVQG